MSRFDEWCSCDGVGHVPASTSRRALLAGGIALAGWAFSRGTVLSQARIAAKPSKWNGNTVVVLFLRGGADGLNILSPYQEDAYFRLRPTLAIPSPTNSSFADRQRSIDVDGFFGLHPSAAPLRGLLEGGSLGFVHACGSQDQSHSHFEAMSAMERGVAQARSSQADGWVARFVAANPRDVEQPMRTLAFGQTTPDSLRGAPGAATLENIGEYRFGGPAGELAKIASMYASGEDAASVSGRQTLQLLDRLRTVAAASSATKYPDSELGKALSQTAALIRADVGMEVALLDHGGWDNHVAQGGTEGFQASRIGDVAASLKSFTDDLGAEMSRVTVVVMTEFGRRVYENSGLGTDHGSGGVLWALGGGVRGGKVYGAWPGLGEDNLDGPGDLKITTDYRSVLAELLERRLGARDAGALFAGAPSARVGLFVGL